MRNRKELEESSEIPNFSKREDPRTGELSQPAEKNKTISVRSKSDREKAKEIIEKAKQGDEKARELVKKLDSEGRF